MSRISRKNDRAAREAIRQHEALVAAWIADFRGRLFPALPRTEGA